MGLSEELAYANSQISRYNGVIQNIEPKASKIAEKLENIKYKFFSIYTQLHQEPDSARGNLKNEFEYSLDVSEKEKNTLIAQFDDALKQLYHARDWAVDARNSWVQEAERIEEEMSWEDDDDDDDDNRNKEVLE